MLFQKKQEFVGKFTFQACHKEQNSGLFKLYVAFVSSVSKFKDTTNEVSNIR